MCTVVATNAALDAHRTYNTVCGMTSLWGKPLRVRRTVHPRRNGWCAPPARDQNALSRTLLITLFAQFIPTCSAAVSPTATPTASFTPGASRAPRYIASTVVGDGFVGSGDGTALSAELWNPQGVFVTRSGDLLIADSSNDRVRSLNVYTGVVTTIAGASTAAVGDGGPAINAQIKFPVAFAQDAAGALYVSEWSGHRIRKIYIGGNISTIAGNGFGSTSNDGVVAEGAYINQPWGLVISATGVIYFAESGGYRVRSISTSGILNTLAGGGSIQGDGGQAISASLGTPTAITLVSGKLYILDAYYNSVRTVLISTGIINTVAGTRNYNTDYRGDGGFATAAAMNKPHGLVLDAAGNLIIADSFSHVIRFVVASTGLISTIAGTNTIGSAGDGQDALQMQLSYPYGLAIDAAGNLFVADSGNLRIRKLTLTQCPECAVNVTGTTSPSLTLSSSAAQTASSSPSPATITSTAPLSNTPVSTWAATQPTSGTQAVTSTAAPFVSSSASSSSAATPGSPATPTPSPIIASPLSSNRPTASDSATPAPVTSSAGTQSSMPTSATLYSAATAASSTTTNQWLVVGIVALAGVLVGVFIAYLLCGVRRNKAAHAPRVLAQARPAFVGEGEEEEGGGRHPATEVANPFKRSVGSGVGREEERFAVGRTGFLPVREAS